MAVNRRMRNDKIRLSRVPVRTRGHMEIVSRNVDVSSASLEQEGEFGSGPALLKGDPVEGCHVFGGVPMFHCVVVGHIASSSLLYLLKLLDVVMVMGVPDAAAVF